MKRAWQILLTLALAAQTALAAAPTFPKPAVKMIQPIPPVGPSPITSDCRFLFVVDTSSAMQRFADGLYRSTHRLIANGLGGRMQEGDVFTVWTYADTVLTREFPLNAWTPDLNIALANRAYEFLAQQKFRGKSNLRPVFAELGQALAISTNLTIVLISDGTDVIVGTPFDRPINVTYGKRASEMRSTKMPFVTALATRGGEFTHWSVRAGLEDIGLPFPEKPVVPVPSLVQAPAATNPAPTPIPIPAVTTLPPPVVTAPSKPVAPTNRPPTVVTLPPKPKEPVTPPPPAPKPAETAKAPPSFAISTNTAPTKPPATALPKPPEPTPAVVVTKKVEPVPAPTLSKPDATPAVPAPKPKLEAKADLPPPPKPVIETAKAPLPEPKTAVPTVSPTPPVLLQQPIAKANETLVMPAIPPAIPPALRQPKSVLDASNALVKVELLRTPVSTSAPPAKPLDARVVEPKPVAPKLTNAPVVVVQPVLPAPPTVTNPPTTKFVTNAVAAVAANSSPSKTIPIVIPPARDTPAPPRAAVAPVPAPKPTLSAANSPTAKSNSVVVSVNAPLPPKAKTEVALPKASAPVAKPVPSAEAPKPTKPAGQLAVASPTAHRGNWIYLAAAVGLLVLAGGIIVHLLRPRPAPSAISQSLDDQRVL